MSKSASAAAAAVTVPNEETAVAVQRDWVDREYADILQLNIMKIAMFLNDFESTMRTRLIAMNDRLVRLERVVNHCDIVCNTTLASQRPHK